MDSKAERYRQYANACCEEGARAKEWVERQGWLTLARQWERMARSATRKAAAAPDPSCPSAPKDQ